MRFLQIRNNLFKLLTVLSISFSWSVSAQNCSGCLDLAFGVNGEVRLPALTTGINQALYKFNSGAARIVSLPNGKLLALSWEFKDFTYHSSDVALYQLMPDGSIDTTFGSSGKYVQNFGQLEVANDVAVAMDGKIYLGGFLTSSTSSSYYPFLVRLNPNGRIDTSFSVDGLVTGPRSGSFSQVRKVLPLVDGKVLAAIQVDTAWWVVRFKANGSIDTTFGNEGVFTLSGMSGKHVFSDMKLLSDGSILIAGLKELDFDGSYSYSSTIAKITSSGASDPNFGSLGTLKFDGTPNTGYQFWSIKTNPDGSFFIGGTRIAITENYRYDALVYKYGADGIADRNFSNNGRWEQSFGVNASVFDMMGTDEHLYLVGQLGPEPFVASISSDGIVEKSFGANGFATFTSRPAQITWGVASGAMTSSGKIVIFSKQYSRKKYFNSVRQVIP